MTINIERLTNLRRVVEQAPDHLFHMRALTEESSCGTARCALGWALVDPWFQQDGIETIKKDHAYTINVKTVDWSSRLPQYFGLTEINSHNLFGTELSRLVDPHAVSKAEVLVSIDRLLDGKRALPYKVLRRA